MEAALQASTILLLFALILYAIFSLIDLFSKLGFYNITAIFSYRLLSVILRIFWLLILIFPLLGLIKRYKRLRTIVLPLPLYLISITVFPPLTVKLIFSTTGLPLLG